MYSSIKLQLYKTLTYVSTIKVVDVLKMTIHVGIKGWQTPYVQRKLIFRNTYIVILCVLQGILGKKKTNPNKLVSTTLVNFMK